MAKTGHAKLLNEIRKTECLRSEMGVHLSPDSIEKRVFAFLRPLRALHPLIIGIGSERLQPPLVAFGIAYVVRPVEIGASALNRILECIKIEWLFNPDSLTCFKSAPFDDEKVGGIKGRKVAHWH